MKISDIYVVKKDGTTEKFNSEKIVRAVSKSAERVLVKLTDKDIKDIIKNVTNKIQEVVKSNNSNQVTVNMMHTIVESSLDNVNADIAKSYREYRNYKVEFVGMMDRVYKEANEIQYLGDRNNANTDSALVSTKRSLVYSSLNKELYKKFFLSTKELQAAKDGYIYIHDMSARRDTFNCCIADIKTVLTGGFEMANQWYNEPKSLDTAFDVIGDIVLSSASQQYGGYTIPEVDKLLEPYAEKSYSAYYKESLDKERKALNKSIKAMREFGVDEAKIKEYHDKQMTSIEKISDKYAESKVCRDFQQGFQGWEYKFNTVASSRGDYPFIAVTFGLGTTRFAKMASIEMCKVRAEGQGKEGFKRLVLFPKMIFLYDSRIHETKKAKDVKEAALMCSSKAMYPDWLSLEPGSYVGDIYHKYGEVISPMGCRAFLSPYYKRGGFKPADENDTPFYVGRFNLGVVSLNLPMIYMKAKQENRDFYEVLDEYLEIIRGLHKKTYDYLGEMKASVNPIMYCQGGLYGGHLNPDDKIRPILKYTTSTFGYTALNELQELYNGKSIYADGEFAKEVLEHINEYIAKIKEEDGISYAIYGTPAESLSGTQVKQFRRKYGIVNKVSDKEYFTNSFHCFVGEDITPTQKQDSEKRFWDLSNGGKIQYVRHRNDKNLTAINAIITRAMKMGFYEGVNFDKDYCEDCGEQGIDFPNHRCPKCGSKNIVEVNRVCGYLGYTKVHGKSRMNDAKLSEIADRKSM